MTPHEATEQGLAAHKAGRLSEAQAHYEAALREAVGFHPALHLMGLLFFQKQDHARALEWFSRAVAVEPAASIASRAGRGEVLLELNRLEEALDDFDRVLAADPGMAAVWNNRGLALNALKRHEEALASYERAIALAPLAAQAHNNRGDALRELRRFGEALASFDRALAIKPDDWASLNNRAIALSLMGRMDEALASYDRALAIEPNIPAALHARGNLNWAQKSQLGPAIADLERLVKLASDFPFARGSLMRLKMNAAAWDDYAGQKEILDEGVRAGRPVIEPFIYLALSDRPQDLKACAELYARMRFPAQPAPGAAAAKSGKRKIRVGYVCGEFRKHATLYLMAGLFECHDRDQFDIFAFDNGGSDDSELRRRFEAAVTNIVDIRQTSDFAAAARIRAAEIDILVDLNGYSGEQRLGIFAHRPAPVQVSWLAYPGTLGAPYLDYILADRIVIPEGEEKYFREKVVRLPHSYQINDDKRAIAETISRAEAGLPEDGFVFCNFNHANKFTPETFDLWMRILGQVPGSRLWLLAPHAIAQENLKAEARARGVDPARLVFAPHLPFARHLARLRLADLFLDGLPYGAHTTASDALWAGLPLITRRGDSFAGRVASSLLAAIGMDELVTQNTAQFEALALGLASEPARLAAIREKLTHARDRAPLFDTARTTRAVETAFRMMLEGPPRNFDVPA